MKKIFVYFIILSVLSYIAIKTHGSLDGNKDAEKLLRKVGMSEKLDAGVVVTQKDKGLIRIKDNGVYITHYMIVGPNSAAEPNITIERNVTVLPTPII